MRRVVLLSALVVLVAGAGVRIACGQRTIVPPPEEPVSASIPAFPGAVGWGANTPGGRGGRVIEVTSLAADGPGSFAEALAAEGPRIVVFRVGGIIETTRNLSIRHPYCTIAGQTAPGDGICIKGGSLRIGTHDVVIRGLRIRVGDGEDGPDPENRDSIDIAGDGDTVYNVLIDHCSLSWAVDETLTTWYTPHHVTAQWCVISESLHDSLHPKGPHGMGVLVGDNSRKITLHHNLLIHNNGRNPLFKGGTHAEFVNNLVVNWGGSGANISDYERRCGPCLINIVGNVYQAGVNSSSRVVRSNDRCHAETRIHIADNLLIPYGDKRLVPWEGPEAFLTDTPAEGSGLSIESTDGLADRIIASVGAVSPVRDDVDNRLIGDVENRTGAIIDSQQDVGGWPRYNGAEPRADADHDGMPDEWERRHGLDPNDPTDAAKDRDGDLYTNVEEYVNGLI
jgi:pectate lyase